MNNALVGLLDSLHLEPMAAAKVRFCIIGFSDDAVCYLEPTDLRHVETMPNLTAKASTSFAAVFDALRERIPRDIANLKSDGYIVNRPSVFLLTDGVPNANDGWEGSYQKLIELRQHPNILAFGIGDADPGVIRRVATRPEYGFIAATGTDPGLAITRFLSSLTQSVIASGHALATGGSSLPVEQPPGFITVPVDAV
ncbi:vWA domain-containing protein [Nocardia yunnanensis]|uniref:vWA domain-containing protein n=1 Tax=Nocardia yunnanensis TaxID=2382165 RepID=UPI0013C42046|nr:hypothetical protein [Nocardia yunnanensis]